MDLKKSVDGSVDIYCGPKAPTGFESEGEVLPFVRINVPQRILSSVDGAWTSARTAP